MKLLFYTLLFTSFCSCIGKSEKTEIEVQDVNLEEVVDDSSEMKEPPIPPPPIDHSKDQVVRLTYNAIECTCAQWSESKYDDDVEHRELIFIERASNSLMNADSIWNGECLPLQIEVVGQYKPGKGYSRDYHPAKGRAKPARVFRYSKIKILRNCN